MRDDMKKVLVDTYRVSRRPNFSLRESRRKCRDLERHLTVDGDFEPDHYLIDQTKMPMRPRGPTMRKDFGERLTPLKRYIRKQEGRDWDEVFSEISRNCPKNSTVGAHIYQHLWDYVDRHVVVIDDQAYRSEWRNRPLTAPEFAPDVYVHPVSKKLVRPPKPSPKQSEATDINFVAMDDYTFAVRKDGVWFEVKMVAMATVQRKIKRKVTIPHMEILTFKFLPPLEVTRYDHVDVDDVVTEYVGPPSVAMPDWLKDILRPHFTWYEALCDVKLYNRRSIRKNGGSDIKKATKRVVSIRTMSKKQKKAVIERIAKDNGDE